MSIRVVIADDEPITRMDLKEMLQSNNYKVVGEAADGFDVIEICRKVKPDLVLMDIKMPLLDGLSASKIIMEEALSPAIILLTAFSGSDFISEAKKVGVSGYLVKPIQENALLPALELTLEQSRIIQNLQKEVSQSQQKMEDRKTIERAKGILMEQRKISEKEAYEYIRMVSMNKRATMGEIAKAIILSSSRSI